jgi:hypothetical protein
MSLQIADTIAKLWTIIKSPHISVDPHFQNLPAPANSLPFSATRNKGSIKTADTKNGVQYDFTGQVELIITFRKFAGAQKLTLALASTFGNSISLAHHPLCASINVTRGHIVGLLACIVLHVLDY